MDERPLVTIIIPFLNAEKFFEEAVESVLAQTYTEWELILVDDGSTDKSTHIALEYKNKHPDKISYLQHNQHVNRGISASRNLGIKYAKGKYLAMLDADDRWVENKLEQQVEIMEAYPDAGMVYGTTKYWYSWTKDLNNNDDDFIFNLQCNLNNIHKAPKLLTRLLESETTTASISNVMFRLDAVEHVGGFDEKFNNKFEIQAFLAKLYTNYDTFVAGCCWDFHRLQPNDHKANAKKVECEASTELEYLKWLQIYISKNRTTNPQLSQALQHRKWSLENPILYKFLESNRKNILTIKQTLKSMATRVISISIMHYLLAKLRGALYQPPVGFVHFGELRRLKPISDQWGANRGQPIDRYYIEKFLDSTSSDIKGHVLEVGEDFYTHKFGKNHVTRNDVLNLEKGANPKTTIAADLTNAPNILSESFDCIIITQTLQLIYDVHSVIGTLYRILKPGGVVLATVSGISQTTDDEPWDRNWCWGFTSLSARKLFEEKFPAETLEVAGYGNVLVAASFLYGLAKEDLTKEELDFYDSRYEITISVRAIKPV